LGLSVGKFEKDLGIKPILEDPRIQASLRRLKAMGLKVVTDLLDPHTVVIAIDMDSVDKYIERTLYSNITYPNKYIYLEPRTRTLLVFISRSASRIKEIMAKYPRSGEVFKP
jgi:chromosome condensin MukBEF MukE localization factor